MRLLALDAGLAEDTPIDALQRHFPDPTVIPAKAGISTPPAGGAQ